MIKYGELTTKKDNINFFLSTLKDNLKYSLKDEEVVIQYDKGRMFIEANEDVLERVIEKLKKTFGIHEINVGYELEDNGLENVKSCLLELIKDISINTFKVETKRSDKNYTPNSMEISRIIGGVVLKNVPNSKVDVHKPELLINVEIRAKKAYIYFDKIKGISLSLILHQFAR